MVKSIVLCLASLSLAGCACFKPQIEYRTADVPEPPAIKRPDLEVLTINSDMDPGAVIQAHRTTIINLKSWGLELEKALDAYRKKQ